MNAVSLLPTPMPRIQRSIIISRPVPEVFSFMDDIHLEREWQPNLRAAEQEPAGPVGVGTLKRYTSEFLKKEVRNAYRCTAYELYVRTVYESTPDSTVDATAEICWEPVPEGTRVTWTIDASPRGALRLMPGALVEKASIHELEETLARLKARLESG